MGVLTWTLAFKVDTNGKTVDEVLFSNDWGLIKKCLFHHVPSLFLGGAMKYLAPKNPFYLVFIVFSIISVFYMIMFCFGISREEMVLQGWFWSSGDLHYKKDHEIVRMSFIYLSLLILHGLNIWILLSFWVISKPHFLSFLYLVLEVGSLVLFKTKSIGLLCAKD